MANVKDIGKELVELCAQGKNADAIQKLYAKNVVSVEAAAQPGGSREMAGLEAVLGKNQWWSENHEVHSATVNGPWPHGEDKFAVQFQYDLTSKPMGGKRMKMEEIAVYTVKDGKVAREEFFYDM